MATPLPLRPDPPRILLVASRPGTAADQARAAELRRLLATDGVDVHLVSSGSSTLPDPRPFGAVVTDGDPCSSHDDEWLADLRSAVEHGTSLLALLRASDPGARRGAPWL